ncbi:hypothetical protein E8E12_007727 [Didymella heteroderae]|uniref:Hydrolase n=1 Tax=Didymella heteroderae TaxID=1769908 RepID=A0A9P5C2F3_9PLEO|nr:hypothetical protein E8E12_007727 [Didymella heteroderae]
MLAHLRHPMFRYDSPAYDWDGALPLGNGRLGAMVYGGVHRETLCLNEESVWYGGPMNRTPVGAKDHLDDLRQLIRVGKHRDAEALVGKYFLATPRSMRHYEPLGTCAIDFEYGGEQQCSGSSKDSVTDYARSLDLSQAEAVVQYIVNGVRVRREAFATHTDNVIALRVLSDKQISFRLSLTRMSHVEWEVNEFLDSIEIVKGCIVLHATPGGKGSNSLCLVAGARVHGPGGIQVIGRELEVTAKDAIIVLAAHTQYRHNAVQQAAMSDVEAALQLGSEALLHRHLTDWQARYDRMSIQLFPDNDHRTTSERLKNSRDPGVIALYHAYARYLLLSCSRVYNKALPANLQGIWNPKFQPAWGSKFTINVNLQMCYWAAHTSHLSECELPLFDLLERMAINGKQTASEDRWLPSTLWPLGGAWLCTHIWEHYSFTGDKSLLDRMLPVLGGCIDFLLDFLIEDVNCIAECLVQSHEEVKSQSRGCPVRILRLLPSCPAEWKTGNIRGARCRGGFELAFEWDNGHIKDPDGLLQKNKDPTLNETDLPDPPAFLHDQFLFFGDSITQSDGDPALGFSCYQALQHDYSRRIDFVKRGFSGYNTVNALSILPRIFPKPEQGRVRLLSIFFGANDISFPNTTGQHVPLHVFEENLRRLIKHPRVRAHEDIRVLLVTPPPIDEWGFDHWDEPGRTARKAATARQYAERVRKVGEEMDVAVADLWSACMEEATVGRNASLATERGVEPVMPGDKRAERNDVLARLLYDGLHLSGDGYRLMYQKVKETIIKAYPEIRPSQIPVALEPFFPEWFEDNAPW